MVLPVPAFSGIKKEIPRMRIDMNDKPIRKLSRPKRFPLYFYENVIRLPEATISREDFPAGAVSEVPYGFWHDEIHYILEGKAEVTYSLAYTSHSEIKTMNVEAGDIYVIPRGAALWFKVDSSGPLKKLCIIMPSPPAKPADAMAPGSVEMLNE